MYHKINTGKTHLQTSYVVKEPAAMCLVLWTFHLWVLLHMGLVFSILQ